MTSQSLYDPLINQVRVVDACHYLEQRGWVRRPFPRSEVILFEGPLDDDGVPVIQLVPASQVAPGYQLRVVELLRALSIIEDRPARRILLDIVTQSPAVAEDVPLLGFANTVQPIVDNEIESRQLRPRIPGEKAQSDDAMKRASDTYERVNWRSDPDQLALTITAAWIANALAQNYESGELISAVAIRILRMWGFDREEFSEHEIQRIDEFARRSQMDDLIALFKETMEKTPATIDRP